MWYKSGVRRHRKSGTCISQRNKRGGFVNSVHLRPGSLFSLRRRPSIRPFWLAVAGLLLVGNMGLGTASASAATQTISSSGPLTRIVISDQLNCQVNHISDAQNEFFPPAGDIGACTTQIAVGGTLYGPDEIPFGNDPTPFTPVSQSAVTGSGTAANPFRIVTVVDVGTTGLRITETDSYIVGEQDYRTDVSVTNTGSTAQNAILYRAGDCFLQDSDEGFGRVNPATGEVACVGPADPSNPSAGPGSRIIQYSPISPGSSYYEASFREVWDRIDTMLAFPNTCRCGDFIDNGAGLSWTFAVPAGGTETRSHRTTFAPRGINPRACSDGLDNDSDGKTDFGTGPNNDPGCSSAEDDDETDPPPPPKQCSDGRDNDSDGKTDFGTGPNNDPGCSSPNDNNEANPPPPPPARHCTINGTRGNDIIRGTPGRDVICAGAGNDIVSGRGGNDVILGGSGNDILRGEDGNDRIEGGSGNDILKGGSGNDILKGGLGRDTLVGGPGHDNLSGGSGNDILKGGSGRDTLVGGSGNDILKGGGDPDSCTRDPGDRATSC